MDKAGRIDRGRLGQIAFSSPEALKTLESITHPAVLHQIDRVIERAPKDIVVIEAIKLLESGLGDKCDAIWVVNASKENQLRRLVTKRNMSKQEAFRRIEIQGDPKAKIARADVVIDNNGGLVNTWNLVQQNFNKIPKPDSPKPAQSMETTAVGDIEVRRAKRTDLLKMAELVSLASQGQLRLDEGDMMERLFSKGYLLAFNDGEMIGVVGWQTENLIAGIDDLFVKTSDLWGSVGVILMDHVEKAVSELSCEAGLVFLHHSCGPVARQLLEKRGYEEKDPKNPEKVSREVREAAREWYVDGTLMLFRQFLERRIMTPI